MSTWSVVYPKAGIEPEFLFFMQYQGEVKLNPDGVLCKSFKSSGLLKAAGGGRQAQEADRGSSLLCTVFKSN
jgi:hypothetical protein